MTLRLALHELTERYALNAADAARLHDLAGLNEAPAGLARALPRGLAVLGADAARLHALAGLNEAPAGLARALPRGLAVLGAALGGFGLVMWVAAHWDDFGRHGRFALLMGFVAVMGAGALWRPAARAPLALLVLLGTGALFAYFGQAYQTGADPWQLFALWAALGLPLCLGTRSDVVWAPWSLVTAVAIALWTHAHLGQSWRVQAQDLGAHAVSGLATALLVGLLARPLQRYSGAGVWALRSAVTWAVVMVTLSAVNGLFSSVVAPQYGIGLLLFTAAAVLFSWRPAFDVYALSAVALGGIGLLTAGLARLLFDDRHGDEIGAFLLVGLAAAGMLAASVQAILRLARLRAGEGVAHG